MVEDVLQFWFEVTAPAQWWRADPAFDALVTERFGDLHERACRGELFGWRAQATGRLAEVIVLDQFSRNIHRGTARAFAADPMALALAQEAVARGDDRTLSPVQRSFLYLPYMHSESRLIQAQSEALYAALGMENNLDFARRHRAVIERFGRYPHRNAVLGRESTAEERAYLAEPGAGF